MNYSIWLKDASGLTRRSEVVAFDTDADAAGYANAELAGSAIVEVWKADHLLARFFRDDPSQSTPAAKNALGVERKGFASWENEGGAPVVRQPATAT